MTIIERAIQLERENARLRSLLGIIQGRFAEAGPGHYLALDDGDLDGPYRDIDKAAKNCVDDGVSCTIVTVKARMEADAHAEDFGVRPGRDYPATLGRFCAA